MLPIRPGHIQGRQRRTNRSTGQEEEFDPVQIFTSPSIHYCAYGDVYCDRTEFKGDQYQVAFQLWQQPESYNVGQETLGAERKGEMIDPLFSNRELEYYTRKGVHRLYRLLVRKVGPGSPWRRLIHTVRERAREQERERQREGEAERGREGERPEI